MIKLINEQNIIDKRKLPFFIHNYNNYKNKDLTKSKMIKKKWKENLIEINKFFIQIENKILYIILLRM